MTQDRYENGARLWQQQFWIFERYSDIWTSDPDPNRTTCRFPDSDASIKIGQIVFSFESDFRALHKRTSLSAATFFKGIKMEKEGEKKTLTVVSRSRECIKTDNCVAGWDRRTDRQKIYFPFASDVAAVASCLSLFCYLDHCCFAIHIPTLSLSLSLSLSTLCHKHNTL